MYQPNTGGEAITSSAAAEIARKATTPQPRGTSNRWCRRAGVPGGPLMKVAVTGRLKPLVSTAISTAWAASTMPTPMFQQPQAAEPGGERGVGRAGERTVAVARGG